MHVTSEYNLNLFTTSYSKGSTCLALIKVLHLSQQNYFQLPDMNRLTHTKEKVITVNSKAVISYHFFFIRNEDVGDPKCSHLTSSEIGLSKNQKS